MGEGGRGRERTKMVRMLTEFAREERVRLKGGEETGQLGVGVSGGGRGTDGVCRGM
jgi:hypothetical protein